MRRSSARTLGVCIVWEAPVYHSSSIGLGNWRGDSLSSGEDVMGALWRGELLSSGDVDVMGALSTGMRCPWWIGHLWYGADPLTKNSAVEGHQGPANCPLTVQISTDEMPAGGRKGTASR